MIWLYILFFIVSMAAFFVILSKNPVQSVLFLILVYLVVAIFFMFLGAEFLSILILIIYVGAISILFLFVVMLLNLRTVELYNTFLNYFPIGSFIGFLFIFEIFYLFSFDFFFTLEPFF
jgi:NADH-quinone oxidoreductase subunit J